MSAINFNDAYLKVMEYLSVNDIVALSKTSTWLNDTAQSYIAHAFKRKTVSIKTVHNNVIYYPEDEFTHQFLNSTQQVSVYGLSSPVIDFLAEHFTNRFEKIKFKTLCERLPEPQDVAELYKLKDTLENVTILEFHATDFSGPRFDVLLEFAKNMRELIIIDSFHRIDTQYRPIDAKKRRYCFENEWHRKTYAKLETIQWDDGVVNKPDELATLFRQNPRLKNLKVSRNITAAIKFIEGKNVHLKLFSVNLCQSNTKVSDFDLICNDLNTLYQNGYYERLHFAFDKAIYLQKEEHFDHLLSLKALHRLTFAGEYHTSISRLENLKELRIHYLENGTEAATFLHHIEIVHVEECALIAITPFIRFAKKLTKIAIEHVLRDDDVPHFDIDALGLERELLIGARPLTLFLQEWAYLIVKFSAHSPKMIEIRRFESFLPIE